MLAGALDEERQIFVHQVDAEMRLVRVIEQRGRLELEIRRAKPRGLNHLEQLARLTGAMEDATFRTRLMRFQLDVADLNALYREFSEQVRRGEKLGADISILKIFSSETYARIADFIVETGGSGALSDGPSLIGNEQAEVVSAFYASVPPKCRWEVEAERACCTSMNATPRELGAGPSARRIRESRLRIPASGTDLRATAELFSWGRLPPEVEASSTGFRRRLEGGSAWGNSMQRVTFRTVAWAMAGATPFVCVLLAPG